MTKFYSREEELNILEQLENAVFLGHGSSRAVFEFGENKVVKVAVDSQGAAQNFREAELFDIMGKEFLAEVFGVGDYILVMERVRVRDTDMQCYEYCELQDTEMEVVDAVEEYNGGTTDNHQIGYRGDCPVAYDYGYESYGNDKYVSNILYDIADRDPYEVVTIALQKVEMEG